MKEKEKEKNTLNRLLHSVAKKEVGVYSERWLSVMLGFAFVYSMYLCMTTAGMAIPIGILSAICGAAIPIIWEERSERIRVMETHMQDWVLWKKLFGACSNDALKGKYFRVDSTRYYETVDILDSFAIIHEMLYTSNGKPEPSTYTVRVEMWPGFNLKPNTVFTLVKNRDDITEEEISLGITPIIPPGWADDDSKWKATEPRPRIT